MSLTTTLPLPGWLRVGWVVVLAGVLGVHLGRAARQSGQRRWWHGSYALVTVAMIVMYLFDPLTLSGRGGVPVGVFVGAVVLLVLVASSTLLLWRREGRPNPAWVVATADVLTLAYLQIPAAVRPVVVCVVFAAYLAAQVVAWLVGAWARAGVPRTPHRPAPAPSPDDPATSPAARSAPATSRAAAPLSSAVEARRFGLDPATLGAVGTRLAMALIAVGMFYLLSV